VPLADGCKAQKVERFRLAFSALLPVGDGVWPQLNQTRFVRVYFQAELPVSRLQVHQEALGVLSAFEANHAIIRVADHHGILLGDFLAPGFHP
jgi:hypothetical protein